jgi:hypothetical protein
MITHKSTQTELWLCYSLSHTQSTSLTLKRPFLSGYTKAKDSLAFFLLAAGATSLTCKRNIINYRTKKIKNEEEITSVTKK